MISLDQSDAVAQICQDLGHDSRHPSGKSFRFAVVGEDGIMPHVAGIAGARGDDEGRLVFIRQAMSCEMIRRGALALKCVKGSIYFNILQICNGTS